MLPHWVIWSGHCVLSPSQYCANSGCLDVGGLLIKVLNKNQNLPEDSTQLYAFDKINDTQKFYLQDDSLVIYFDLYEIAPYVAGIPEFAINKDVINNLLNEEYKQIIFYTP